MTDAARIEALRALAHPVRYRLLQSLEGGERNVGEIESVTGVEQPGLSQQLAVLRKAGLVETRKEAKLVFYRLHGEALGKLGAEIGAFCTAAAPFRPRRRTSPGAANFARLHI
ncbi:MAG: metalloregulator ArsR/SmtB family transcription factor, partial [Alteraurantiacibacter sp.]